VLDGWKFKLFGICMSRGTKRTPILLEELRLLRVGGNNALKACEFWIEGLRLVRAIG